MIIAEGLIPLVSWDEACSMMNSYAQASIMPRVGKNSYDDVVEHFDFDLVDSPRRLDRISDPRTWIPDPTEGSEVASFFALSRCGHECGLFCR